MSEGEGDAAARVRLSADFVMWPWAALRGAGFPADGVGGLAASAAARAADALLDAEWAARQAVAAALEASFAAAPRSRQHRLARRIARLRDTSSFAPDLLDVTGIAGDAAATILDARGRFEAARARFTEAFAEGRAAVAQAAVELAASPRFREAVALQTPGARSSLPRRVEDVDGRALDLVAKYAQRYCLKNDSIGFFGPVGWATLSAAPFFVDSRPGPALVTSSWHRFEGWPIDALARRFADDPSLRAWRCPRVAPMFHFEGGALHRPMAGAEALPAAEAALFARVDGATPAARIAAALAADPSLGVKDVGAALAIVEKYVDQGVLSCDFELPLTAEPAVDLRARLELVGDDIARARSLGMLDELCAGRDRVAAASGDGERVEAAIDALAATFERLTGAAPSRAHGQVYGGRTLVYADAVRGGEHRIGQALCDRLARPLSLLLQSASWMTTRVAATFRARVVGAFEQLASMTGRDEVDFGVLYVTLLQDPGFFGGPERTADAVAPAVEELQRRWAEVLPIGEGGAAVSSADLDARARAAFPASGPGWGAARYMSPDLLICAPTAASLLDGAGATLVLGELHLANTLWNGLMMSAHPRPDALSAALRVDDPAPAVVPLTPKWFTGHRTSRQLVAPGDLWLRLGAEPAPIGVGDVLPMGAFIVRREREGEGERETGALVVLSRDGSRRYDVIEFLGTILTATVASHFHPFPIGRHRGRASIDGVVVAREAWRVPVREVVMASPNVRTSSERFLAARRFRREHDLPRFAFAKVATELKPFFVDLESPALVDALAHFVRASARRDPESALTLTEMLPAFDDLWLADDAGRRYTAELRCVAVDARPSTRGVKADV